MDYSLSQKLNRLLKIQIPQTESEVNQAKELIDERLKVVDRCIESARDKLKEVRQRRLSAERFNDIAISTAGFGLLLVGLGVVLVRNEQWKQPELLKMAKLTRAAGFASIGVGLYYP
ncbi:MAG: hypothetical protein AB7F31_05395 [Parachlamydiales bacterium]